MNRAEHLASLESVRPSETNHLIGFSVDNNYGALSIRTLRRRSRISIRMIINHDYHGESQKGEKETTVA